MTDNTIIRIAFLSDCKDIAELLGQLGYPSTPSDVEQRLEHLGNLPSEQVLVAEIDGRVVGLTSVHLTPCLHITGYVGRITSFVVAAEFRGRGIGSRLFQEAESWACSRGCTRMGVTSGDYRPGAHRFYEACGYRCDERRFLKRR
jgi:GNAT superfamily N-acetyltransferase